MSQENSSNLNLNAVIQFSHPVQPLKLSAAYVNMQCKGAHTVYPVANICFLQTQGDGYLEVPPPETLSFSSPKNDAAITFINSTAVNGVVFQHNRAFDIVASADVLVVRQNDAQHSYQ